VADLVKQAYAITSDDSREQARAKIEVTLRRLVGREPDSIEHRRPPMTTRARDSYVEPREGSWISKDPAKEQAKAEARAEKERAAEEARFWASPRGQARKAREEGRTWVQIVAPISETRIGTTGFVTGLT